MTPGQRRWLGKLRDDGPQRRPRFGALPCDVCKRQGWSKGQWIDSATGGALTRDEAIKRGFEGAHVEELITDAGRAALAGAN